MKINEIRDNDGSRHAHKRRGRGNGSGIGKTGGRGHKGQKARSGVALNGFEGGQMPLHRRMPKRGFKNVFQKDHVEVNLDKLQRAVDQGAIDASKPVDAEAIRKAGIVKRTRDGVRVLGRGELSAKLDLRVAGVSGTARKAIEAQGGSVTIANAEKMAEAQARKTTRAKKPVPGQDG